MLIFQENIMMRWREMVMMSCKSEISWQAEEQWSWYQFCVWLCIKLEYHVELYRIIHDNWLCMKLHNLYISLIHFWTDIISLLHMFHFTSIMLNYILHDIVVWCVSIFLCHIPVDMDYTLYNGPWWLFVGLQRCVWIVKD